MKIRIRDYRSLKEAGTRLEKLEAWCRAARVQVVLERSEGGYVAVLERQGQPFPIFDAAMRPVPLPRPCAEPRVALLTLADILAAPRTYVRLNRRTVVPARLDEARVRPGVTIRTLEEIDGQGEA